MSVYKFRIKEFNTRKILVQRVELDHSPTPGTTIKLGDRGYVITSVFFNAAYFGELTVIVPADELEHVIEVERVNEPYGLCPDCSQPNLAPGLFHQCHADRKQS